MKINIKNVRNGAFVELRNQMQGFVRDNQVTHMFRVVELPGIGIERVYTTDIVKVFDDKRWHEIEYTRAQIKNRQLRSYSALACDPNSETYWSM